MTEAAFDDGHVGITTDEVGVISENGIIVRQAGFSGRSGLNLPAPILALLRQR